tara:strand:- start:32 stop:214 length:183 start_codon:yes stop_codon:yes gene_type:complete
LENIPDLSLSGNWYFCSQSTFKINYKFDCIIKKIQERDSEDAVKGWSDAFTKVYEKNLII